MLIVSPITYRRINRTALAAMLIALVGTRALPGAKSDKALAVCLCLFVASFCIPRGGSQKIDVVLFLVAVGFLGFALVMFLSGAH